MIAMVLAEEPGDCSFRHATYTQEEKPNIACNHHYRGFSRYTVTIIFVYCAIKSDKIS